MRISDIREAICLEMAVGKANPSKIYWHGTTGHLGKQIAKDGVLKSGKKIWDVNNFQSREGYVYLGSELGPAVKYMKERVWRNKKYHGSKVSTGAIVKVHVPDPEKLVLDENTIATIFLDLYKADYGPPWAPERTHGQEDLGRRILKALPEDDADQIQRVLEGDWEWEHDDNEVFDALTAVSKDLVDKIIELPGIGEELSNLSDEAGYPGELPVEAVWIIDLAEEKAIKTEVDLDKYGRKIPTKP